MLGDSGDLDDSHDSVGEVRTIRQRVRLLRPCRHWVRPNQSTEGVRVSEITNPRELFLHELGDILYVERNLVEEALPKLIDEVQDTELKTGLKEHLSQTRQHVSNVEQVFELLGETPHEEECIAFEGLKKEHEEMVKESSSSSHRPRRPRGGSAHREL